MYIQNINGYDVQITTSKNYQGVISCTANFGTYEKKDGWESFQFGMFTDPSIVLAQSAPGARATEKALQEIQAAGLAKFEQLRAAGELPVKKAAFEVKPGQVIFLDHPMKSEGGNRLAVYEIMGRDSFKCVDLDTFKLKTVDHVRPYSEKFGIGHYYNEGDTVPMDEVLKAVEIAKQKAEEKAEFLRVEAERLAVEKAQKIETGRQIIPAIPEGCTHILAAELREDASDLQTDYFAFNTIKTVYLAFSKHGKDLFDEMRKAAANATDEQIKELANAPKDFENREKYSGGSGYYLGESKYSGWIIEKVNIGGYGVTLEALQIAAAEGRFFANLKEAETAAQEIEAAPATPGKVQIVDYSEKAFAVIGDTKPIKDKLKELGGKFNFRLTCGAGWIFSKKKLEEVKQLFTA